jgi:hypothetical protein
VVGAVLDALSAPAGAGDDRTREQRYHDALQEAMRSLGFCIVICVTHYNDLQQPRPAAQTGSQDRVSAARLAEGPGPPVTTTWLPARPGSHDLIAGQDRVKSMITAES